MDTPDKKLTKVIVDRKKWYRGRSDEYSKLLITRDSDGANEETAGKMCCLGFAALAMGIPERLIADRTDPAHVLVDYGGNSVPDITPKQDAWCRQNFTYLMNANDSLLVVDMRYLDTDDITGDTNFVSDTEREAFIKEHGPAVGLDFEFIN